MEGVLTSLWFVVPANGRVELAAVCLRQLARTCSRLVELGVQASAVVVADDENLETAAALGFGVVERENRPLGRKWNDGYELAGRAGVDYVVPLGSDDWVDPEWVAAAAAGPGAIGCARQSAIVREDARRIARLRIAYDGGDGVRVIPTALLEPVGFRPADDDYDRAIDTSTLRRLANRLGGRPQLVYRDLHPYQIVDWKSDTGQLNSYAACQAHRHGDELPEPFAQLAPYFPAAALDEMRALHQAVAA